MRCSTLRVSRRVMEYHQPFLLYSTFWWRRQGFNLRAQRCQHRALPIKVRPHGARLTTRIMPTGETGKSSNMCRMLPDTRRKAADGNRGNFIQRLRKRLPLCIASQNWLQARHPEPKTRDPDQLRVVQPAREKGGRESCGDGRRLPGGLQPQTRTASFSTFHDAPR